LRAASENKRYDEKYADGKPKASWSAMLANDGPQVGQYLLQG